MKLIYIDLVEKLSDLQRKKKLNERNCENGFSNDDDPFDNLIIAIFFKQLFHW